MKFYVLGPLEVRDDTGASVPVGSPRQRQTLTALLLLTGQPLSRDRIIGALWGDKLPGEPWQALRTRIWEIRSLPAVTERLETLRGAYRLRVEPGELDVSDFAALAEHGRAALADGDPQGAARLLQQAADLWRDPPWADLPPTPVMQDAAARLDELRADASEALLEARLGLGQHRDVTGPLRAIVAADPLREHAWALLMLALYRAGRQADALGALSPCPGGASRRGGRGSRCRAAGSSLAPWSRPA